ncbi:CMGC family protein kinase [Tritrichomonas foetus]|uniref:CMGC family protein kinase n=1 Tax=Tritrichomonas foetus TaxID=1144522 RepID=A0A1J4J9X6_9EUKA|nr:CMGC family protein kinase [Tritrichomonas foetus]|eukprot:OHS95023.1 CMGC family protein kinase [Tritrichomonas foetus]
MSTRVQFPEGSDNQELTAKNSNSSSQTLLNAISNNSTDSLNSLRSKMLSEADSSSHRLYSSSGENFDEILDNKDNETSPNSPQNNFTIDSKGQKTHRLADSKQTDEKSTDSGYMKDIKNNENANHANYNVNIETVPTIKKWNFEQPQIVEITEDVGVPEATWERWLKRISNDDLIIENKRLKDDTDEFDLQILAPLGKGVSGSVFLCKIMKSLRDPSLDGNLLAVKIYKTNTVAISQSENEMVMIPYVQRLSGTSKKSVIPSICHSTKIQGHPALIMNLYGPTLFQIIAIRNYIGLPLTVIRSILTQLLQGLVNLESRGIVHADIKPENVLISLSRFGKTTSFADYTARISQISQTFTTDDYEAPGCLDIALVDWSSSSMGYSQSAPYVQSRYYRAPEVLLRSKYGPSADIWSLGCLAAEMFLGSPLFPGGDEIDMLRQIQLKLGLLPSSLIKKMGDNSLAKHSDEWRIDPSMYVPGNFEIFLRERSGRDDFDFLAFINILRLMLQLNPDARISASSAMLHPFITGSTSQQPMRVITRRDSMMEDSASSSHSRVRRLAIKRKGNSNRDDQSSEV